MPRHSSATQHELARIGLLAELPGETLARLAGAMERETLAPGASPEAASEARLYVVLSGMLRGAGGRVLRPGDHFDGPADAVRAMTAAVVASCDRATFDDVVGSRS
jgi:hypothetical protein